MVSIRAVNPSRKQSDEYFQINYRHSYACYSTVTQYCRVVWFRVPVTADFCIRQNSVPTSCNFTP